MPKFSNASATALDEEGEEEKEEFGFKVFLADVGPVCKVADLFVELENDDDVAGFREDRAGDGAGNQLKEEEEDEEYEEDEDEDDDVAAFNDEEYDEVLTSILMVSALLSSAATAVYLLYFPSTLNLSLLPFSHQKLSSLPPGTAGEDRPYFRLCIQISYCKRKRRLLCHLYTLRNDMSKFSQDGSVLHL